MTDHQARKAEERIRYWGEAYLQSTRESYRRATEFSNAQDPFTAYLYLFVAFNNLYCLLARFDDSEQAKIRAALKRLALAEIDRIYTPEYVSRIRELNDRPTEQFVEGPDAGSQARGVVDMRRYFLGKEAAECVRHVESLASSEAPVEDKLKTLQEVAACLLYTVRNNQFHAVKGPRRLADQLTLEAAYLLLLPLVDALTPVAEQTVWQLRSPSS